MIGNWEAADPALPLLITHSQVLLNMEGRVTQIPSTVTYSQQRLCIFKALPGPAEQREEHAGNRRKIFCSAQRHDWNGFNCFFSCISSSKATHYRLVLSYLLPVIKKYNVIIFYFFSSHFFFSIQSILAKGGALEGSLFCLYDLGKLEIFISRGSLIKRRHSHT